MGDKGDGASQRKRDLAGWKVTEELFAMAPESALFGHCLPAERGVEVDASVLDGERSIAIPIAGCRMDTIQAIMELHMLRLSNPAVSNGVSPVLS